jgi:hypothetical protein
VKLAAVLVLVASIVVACGNQSGKLYSRDATRSCLADKNVRLGGPLDFVATTATGGALKAHTGSNVVTIVFGETLSDADNINDIYHRVAAKNVGIEDVLRQQQNAVMLWHEHPSNEDLATITGCLK